MVRKTIGKLNKCFHFPNDSAQYFYCLCWFLRRSRLEIQPANSIEWRAEQILQPNNMLRILFCCLYFGWVSIRLPKFQFVVHNPEWIFKFISHLEIIGEFFLGTYHSFNCYTVWLTYIISISAKPLIAISNRAQHTIVFIIDPLICWIIAPTKTRTPINIQIMSHCSIFNNEQLGRESERERDNNQIEMSITSSIVESVADIYQRDRKRERW